MFDELLIFNFKAMDKEVFESGIVRISVQDSNSNPFGKSKMIGSYTFDPVRVYRSNKNHELYRKWVPLMDDEDADDIGVQGYLKFSCQIIGPGDKMVVHDEAADRKKEVEEESATGGDLSSLALKVPTVCREWNYIVMKLYRAEGLPIMDSKVKVGGVNMGSAGTDCFGKLAFAGGKVLQTKVKSVKGVTRAAMTPVFNTELWYPFSVPSASQIIKFGLYDKDVAGEELIGQIMERLNKISRSDASARWYNMYGHHEFKLADMNQQMRAAAVAVTSTAQGLNYETYYSNCPDKAPAYKGRCLIEFRIAKEVPPKQKAKMKGIIAPFRMSVSKMAHIKEPPVQAYVLRAIVLGGTELPPFMDFSARAVATTAMSMGDAPKQKLRVRISIGHVTLTTRAAKYEKGHCKWDEMLESEPDTLKFPIDKTQIPDIFIHLLDGIDRPVCFARFKPYYEDESISGSGVKTVTQKFMGFEREAQWVLLQEDKLVDGLDTGTFPGRISIKLGFGRAKRADETTEAWNNCLHRVRERTYYQVRLDE